MKIRKGFVSNSSSASYTLIIYGIDEETFFQECFNYGEYSLFSSKDGKLDKYSSLEDLVRSSLEDEHKLDVSFDGDSKTVILKGESILHGDYGDMPEAMRIILSGFVMENEYKIKGEMRED